MWPDVFRVIDVAGCFQGDRCGRPEEPAQKVDPRVRERHGRPVLCSAQCLRRDVGGGRNAGI